MKGQANILVHFSIMCLQSERENGRNSSNRLLPAAPSSTPLKTLAGFRIPAQGFQPWDRNPSENPSWRDGGRPRKWPPPIVISRTFPAPFQGAMACRPDSRGWSPELACLSLSGTPSIRHPLWKLQQGWPSYSERRSSGRIDFWFTISDFGIL